MNDGNQQGQELDIVNKLHNYNKEIEKNTNDYKNNKIDNKKDILNNTISKDKEKMMVKKNKKDDDKKDDDNLLPKLTKNDIKQKEIENYFKELDSSNKSRKININKIKKNFYKTDYNFPCINKINNR